MYLIATPSVNLEINVLYVALQFSGHCPNMNVQFRV